MNNYEIHAWREFKAAGWLDENEKFCDDMQRQICENVLSMLNAFAEEGHSGFSANYTLNLFSSLARFEPISPITGEDWEWSPCGDDIFQNIRCPHVFKKNGKAWDSNGKVFREANGSCYTNSKSNVPITFPYTPKTEYVAVTE